MQSVFSSMLGGRDWCCCEPVFAITRVQSAEYVLFEKSLYMRLEIRARQGWCMRQTLVVSRIRLFGPLSLICPEFRSCAFLMIVFVLLPINPTFAHA